MKNINNYAIGIDVGGTNTKIALLNNKAKILYKRIIPTSCEKSRLIELICQEIKTLSKLKKVLGVGIGMPGPIDSLQGIVHYLPNIPGWHEVNLKKIIEDVCSLPVFIDNDVNLMALAEFKFGAAKKGKNIVCLTLGTGVGGGLIIEGELYSGSSLTAGEIGHMPIALKGRPCACGGEACLERYVGNKEILNLAKKHFGKDITLEKLSSLAKFGNKKAISIWQEVAQYLGVALTGVVNLINPDTIVIGGGVANSGKILFDRIRDVINERAMRIPKDNLRILKARLGSDAGLIGAGAKVFSNFKGI
jgi:glucokinase